MIKKLLKEQWLGVLAVLILFFLGAINTYVGTTLGGWGMVTAFGVGALAVVASFVVYWVTHTEIVLKELRAQVTLFREIYLFLVTDEHLMGIEGKADEVWVMTPDLYYESSDPDWKKVVYGNIERGARYTYFIEENLKQRFDQYLTDAQRALLARGKTINPDQIVAKFMNIIVPTEVVFYNPNSAKPEGFVVSPVEGAKTNMRMAPAVRDRVLALLKAHIK